MLYKININYSLVLTLVFIGLGIAIKYFKFNIKAIVEREKCPACFGLSICHAIDENKVFFEYTNFYSVLDIFFNIKNVYYGKYNNLKIVMKKLAHQSEFDFFDETICTDPKLLELCSIEKKAKNVNFYNLIVSELTNSNMNDPNVKIRLCPAVTNLNKLLQNILLNNSANNKHLYKYLWSSIKINPEPIILQILLAQDDWPTPQYFGACGRLVIEEYIGLPLLNFHSESWIKRAKIASSLLDAAYKFTFKNSHFAFYLTDVSLDNIAVTEQDKAIFIDLENIIILDKNPAKEVYEKIETWDNIHTNKINNDCQHCFIFSPNDICNHKISDHNYYAICQILIQGFDSSTNINGFLHSPPKNILNKYSELSNLLKKCLNPDISHSRIDIGIQLKELLDKITADTK